MAIYSVYASQVPLSADNSYVLYPALGLVLLLLWRLWRFTLMPYTYPDDPKELPYWIPFLGHWGFLLNSDTTYKKASKYFGTRNIYAITVLGKSIYIVTSPEDVIEIYRNTDKIGLPGFAMSLYKWNGVSTPSLQRMLAPPSAEQKASNPRIQAPHEMIEEYHRQQLHPGQPFKDLMNDKVFPSIIKALAWENLSTSTAAKKITEDTVSVSLRQLCSKIFIGDLLHIYCGEKLTEINPQLLDSFLVWENTSWKFLYRIPHFWSSDMWTAKETINKTLGTYFETPRAERGGNHFITSTEDELRRCGLNSDEVARTNMLHLWAITGNNYKTAFWIMSHIVHSPDLRDRLQKETQPGVVDGVLNMDYLTEKCPLLEAVVNEILRVYIRSALLREVSSPVIIGGKVLQRGNQALVPYHQLHVNQDVWGEDADKFNPQRFIRKKNLSRNAAYRPFGGGPNLCPGRHLARQSMYAFVALMLQYEVALDDSVHQSFPRIDMSKPPLGASAPMHGDDVVLVLKCVK